MKPDGYWLGLVGGIVVLFTSIEVVRRRYVRGRFAVLWMIIGVSAVVLSLAPDLLGAAARLVHVQVPLNLLLFVGLLVLLVMNMQLSAEVGRLEERTRVLAETIALQQVPGDTTESDSPENL